MKVYNVKIFKNLNGLGQGGEWSNTYPIVGSDLITADDITYAVTQFAAIERQFATTDIAFTRAVVSTVEKEAPANRALGVRVIPLGNSGVRPPADAAEEDSKSLPLDMVLQITHGAGNGRAAISSYRGFISAADWDMTGGAPLLTNNIGTEFANGLKNIVFAAGKGWVIPNSAEPSNVALARFVTTVGVKGLGARQRKNSKRKKNIEARDSTELSKRAQAVAREVVEILATIAIYEATLGALPAGLTGIAALRAAAGRIPLALPAPAG